MFDPPLSLAISNVTVLFLFPMVVTAFLHNGAVDICIHDPVVPEVNAAPAVMVALTQ